MIENIEINDKILQLIVENLPDNTTAVKILEDVLGLHRESAYRRIRGDVKFSLEEVIQLQNALNLPLDSIFKGMPNTKQDLKAYLITNNPLDQNNYCKSVVEVVNKTCSNLAHVYMALNVIPYNFMFNNELLSRMHYYKWLSERNDSSNIEYSLSKSIPHSARERQLFLKEHIESNNITQIYSDDMFESTCKEIQYYKLLGYISEEELILLKAELLSIVDDIAELCKNEHFKSGSEVSIYISNIDINTSFYYIESDNSEEKIEASIHYLHGSSNHIISYSNNIVDITKNCFSSLVRYSTLISKSGAKYRFPYLLRQQELINSMK